MRPLSFATTLLLLAMLSLLPAIAYADGSAGAADGTSGDPEAFGDSTTAGAPTRGVPALPGGIPVGTGTDEDDGGELDVTDAFGGEGDPRLKDIGKVGGLRTNQLYGIGVVMGLAGSGDDSQLTTQIVSNFLKRQDLPVDAALLKGKNVAAVTITAVLPPFVQVGDTIDITISAMGNTKSLEGGILLLSPLKAPNGELIALGQGAITLGAVGASAGSGGARASAQKNFLTVGKVLNGAIVERPVISDLPSGGRFQWVLKEADFTTAQRAADALNTKLPGCLAIAEDAQAISLQPPSGFRGTLVDFLAQVEQIQVATDAVARIVVNERNGTIVAGQNVRIKPMSVVHGNLSLTVTEGFAISQPTTPFGGGSTAIIPGADVDLTEDPAQQQQISTVQDLLDAVTKVGGSIRDGVAILQALKAAGAIDAELVVI